MACSRVPAVGRRHRDRGLTGPAGRPRASRRSGWLPWAALVIGTVGSLAANVATAGPGTINRLIAGWPALALLIAVKLLSGMLDRDTAHRPALPDVMPSRAPGNDTGNGDGTAPWQAVPVLSARPRSPPGQSASGRRLHPRLPQVRSRLGAQEAERVEPRAGQATG
jgi:hypothetical protein